MYEINIQIKDRGSISIYHGGEECLLGEHGDDVVKLLEQTIEPIIIKHKEERQKHESMRERILRWLVR